MFVLLTLLGYRITQDVSLASSVAYVPLYGFQEGGSIDIRLSKLETPGPVLIAACSEDQLETFSKMAVTSKTCDSLSQTCPLSINDFPIDGNLNFNATVTEKAYYRTLIMMCSPQTSDSRYSINLFYRNPDSLMSFDKIPCLYIKPIFCVLFLVACVFWYVNWFINRKQTNSLHTFYTVAITFSVIYMITDMAYYVHYNHSDTNIGVSAMDVIFRFVFEFLFISGFMLICRGFGIINNDYTKWQILETCAYSALVIIALNVLNYVENLWVQLVIFIVFIISFFLLMRTMIKGIRDSMLHVYAHMYVIAEKGIDPSTTPIMSKFKLFNIVNYILIGYFIILIVLTLVTYFTRVATYVSELIIDLINGVILYGAVFLFRLRKQLAQGYVAIGEGAEVQEFTRADIERLNLKDILSRATTPWDGVSTLPPQPKIVDSPTVPVLDSLEDNADINTTAPEVKPVTIDTPLTDDAALKP